ncbi:hypothetical protein [Terriglobus roseus]|uniref:Uncharacterized protein n=1 Tax=Terriglobus roseus TaxID=392734 RepID=A0A1G7I4L4_9BACT|nr:hypothetical protein [Terriglobus roseus]SDF07645.1 hypothetical protein SAMN05444167_1322 [Terriglobus roseus]
MPTNRTTNVLLGLIAGALMVLAARPYIAPTSVHADADSADPIYVEPGVHMIRIAKGGGQVLGKVMVNLRTGNVYGFPTTTSDPYPASPLDNKPQVSHAIPLGRFALEEAR